MFDYNTVFDSHPYAFEGANSILEEKDLGICSSVASVRTPLYGVAAAESFQGCPYTDTAFRFLARINGEALPVTEWTWLPNAMRRRGKAADFTVETVTAVVPGTRTFVMAVTCRNTGEKPRRMPLQVMFRGSPRRDENWEFNIPDPGPADTVYTLRDDILRGERGENAFYITSSVPNMRLFKAAYLWEGEIFLPPAGKTLFWFSCSMGKAPQALAEAKSIEGMYEPLLDRSFRWLAAETRRIAENLPRFTADDSRLERMYNRSLVTYMMCRWDNPDLCAEPFFSTGSINGACMCSYLWDYCGGLMLHPLYDASGNREMLKAYLRNDLTTSYALNPVTGGKCGPWYQVNQEKIICMVYYHVLFTRDVDFLFQQAGERTVLEWMVYHALVGDDPSKPVALYDYGEGGKAHLELRRQYVYNGIMPDLNARRYLNYRRVYELTCAAGCPDERLPQRMAGLKTALKALWNPECRWYDFINAEGKRDIRYTVQMLKFLNSPVIDETEREGLLSHLNEEEFLSKFGLHSMSKTDEAYDQDDIDNGGGGICTHFTMQICMQLYEIGRGDLATDILRRVYWWGERLPYWGDSCAANMIDNREDTPLQGDISSVACAQMMFFGLFGIRADFKGNITVSPAACRPSRCMKAENARLCGRVFSVTVNGDRFTVECGDRVYRANIGETVTIAAER